MALPKVMLNQKRNKLTSTPSAQLCVQSAATEMPQARGFLPPTELCMHTSAPAPHPTSSLQQT